MAIAHRSATVKRNRIWRTLMMAAGLVVVAAGWYLAAPMAVGGRASYVVTDGVSMLPRMQTGGLAITEQESSYHVGEVAAYHNEHLHAVVLHRIVARDGDRFVFKGDNNKFVDSYHPTKSEIVGARVLYVPRLGSYLMDLRQPVVAAILLGLAGMLAVGGRKVSRRRRRRAHHALW